jgi:amidase
MMQKYILAVAACLAAVATPVLATEFRVEEATIPEIEQAFRDHRLTCHQLVQTYVDRIAAYGKQGPKLNAILTLNGNALAAADLLDTSFAHGGKLGALHCVPVVLKDNYNTSDLPTTGGSLSLEGAQPGQDAFVVAQLRSAGAIILAKTNMHEFALAGTTVSSLGAQAIFTPDEPSTCSRSLRLGKWLLKEALKKP